MGTQTLRLPRDAERTKNARGNQAVTVLKMLRTRMRNQDQIRNLRRWAWTTGFVFLLGSCWDCFPDCLLSQKMSSMPRKICPNAFQPCMFSLLKNRLGQLMILISLMALRHHVGVQINLLSSSGKDEEEEE